MTTKHTPGTWRVGRKGTVVTDAPIPGLPGNTGHEDVEYYGGHLIAESIFREEDACLIAAAPGLLSAARRAVLALAEAARRDRSFERDYAVLSAAIA